MGFSMSIERRVLEGLVSTLIAAAIIEGFPWIFPQRGQALLEEMWIKKEWEHKDSSVRMKPQTLSFPEKEK